MRNAFWVVSNAQYRLDGTGGDCFRRLSVAKGTCESFSKSNIFWLTISHQLAAVRFRSAIGCQAKQPVTNHSPADKILIPGLPGPVVTGAYLCTRGAGGRVLYDPCKGCPKTRAQIVFSCVVLIYLGYRTLTGCLNGSGRWNFDVLQRRLFY